MEHGFLCPFIGNFPGATEHQKKWSYFPDEIFQTEIRVTFVKTYLWYQLQVNETDFTVNTIPEIY